MQGTQQVTVTTQQQPYVEELQLSYSVSLLHNFLCECEDRGVSLTLTEFVNFQILSTIVHRVSPPE
jgi:hypothetical protein